MLGIRDVEALISVSVGIKVDAGWIGTTYYHNTILDILYYPLYTIACLEIVVPIRVCVSMECTVLLAFVNGILYIILLYFYSSTIVLYCALIYSTYSALLYFILLYFTALDLLGFTLPYSTLIYILHCM